ncbi:pyridoxal-dependent decarboxylase [Nocardia sp. BMG51109]|uniref:pyridoxal phosphate-dependent decarboxylase family protein n=1 Tax=Nocardia sp. BMG51109 TaxID=1056816 RepID=UPI0012EC2B9B|nr:pyridoxal-dependent decarboxylase [Nocardia sp. BMG51109]
MEESRAGRTPVIRRRPPRDVAARLQLADWIRSGGMTPETFDEFLAAYLDEGTRLHHPGYLAHQCAVPDVPSSLGDLVHGVANNAMSLYEMGAAAATVELAVIDWMLTMLGWSPAAGEGVLVHGGSLANLTALLAARAVALPDAWEDGVSRRAVIVAPGTSHVSIARAVRIMGMGRRGLVAAPTDDRGRIDIGRLPAVLDGLHRDGATVVAVVANACAPATGLYDDLGALAEVCTAHRIWLHVDGAHGCSALLSPGLRHHLAGIEWADSVVWDAHKMLRTSTLAAAVLVRRPAALGQAFGQPADYLFFDDQRTGIDLMLRTVEGAKAELGLKLFLNLAWRGQEGLGEYITATHRMAQRLWELVRDHPNFETPFPPESNIVCFRHGTDDTHQIRVRDRLIAGGTHHLASSLVNGRRYLRATVMSPATDESVLRDLLAEIERCET